MTKSELRKFYLERRRSLFAEEMADKSLQIADRFFKRFDLSNLANLHCFIPIKKFNEIDTSLIYKKVWTDFPTVRTIVPRVNRESGEMGNFVFTAETELIKNEWGIREPWSGKAVDAGAIDMVLVPLLCFDERGYRVGYGKGFYDKFLARCRPDCLKIGLSYFPPVPKIADVGGHDVMLDVFVTPIGVLAIHGHENAETR